VAKTREIFPSLPHLILKNGSQGVRHKNKKGLVLAKYLRVAKNAFLGSKVSPVYPRRNRSEFKAA
jgi:hypothetical protein